MLKTTKPLVALSTTCALGLSALAFASPAMAAPGTTVCERFGSTLVSNDTLRVQNNKWGTNNEQCVVAQDGGFKLSRADGNVGPGAPKSYPSIMVGSHYGAGPTQNVTLPTPVSQIGNARTGVEISTAGGAWNASYDIWFNKDKVAEGQADDTEIMIWMNKQGFPQPIGQPNGKLTVDGQSYTIWQGKGEAGLDVVSYVKDVPTTKINVPIKPFVDEAINRGATERGSYMTSVQFGFEPWEGGAGLEARNFFYQAPNGNGNPTPPPVVQPPKPQPPVVQPPKPPVVQPPAPQPPKPQPPVVQPSGAKAIVGLGSNRCVDVSAASKERGAKVQLWDCNGTGAQQWVFKDGGLVNTNSGKCLDVAYASTKSGAKVQTWDCQKGAPQQQWKLTSDGKLLNGGSGKYLDVAYGSTAKGAALQLWDGGANKSNQAWKTV